jgi:hypothetical protein
MKIPGLSVLVPATLIVSSLIAQPIFGQTPAASAPKAVAPYEVTVFATGNSTLSAPDSIAVVGNHVFVGYGDGHAPDGSDGKNSQVVEYRIDDGRAVHTYTVPGHNDGLKLDPATGLLWALQNEDGNSNLVIINTVTKEQKLYTIGTGSHGGGYDDIVFRGCQVYFSASNPAHNPNTEQAIVTVRLGTTNVDVKEALAGDASATANDRRHSFTKPSRSGFNDARSFGRHRSGQPSRSATGYRDQSDFVRPARIGSAADLSIAHRRGARGS